MPTFHAASPVLLALVLLAPAGVLAQSDPDPIPEPPPLPARVESGEPLEPEVTIIQRETETVEEYRLNGRLYMIRVTPVRGPSYYLIDADGDGELDTRRSELDPGFLIPGWVLHSW